MKDFFSEFSEIELANDVDPFTLSVNHNYYDYYELKISNLRKLKLQSLKDEKIKQKVIQLQSLLYNENFIKLYEEKPDLQGQTNAKLGKHLFWNIW